MLSIGVRVPHELFGAGPGALGSWLARAEDLGLDQVCVGDHVSFRDGTGYDGLLQATAVAALSRRLDIHTAVYVLPLRHPVVVARQVASLAELAPGRFSFGVGIGGEDPHEMAVCGVDPRTRGRRMDEALSIVGRLLRGQEATFLGEFFLVSGARILPVPEPRVPILVGGRSEAALRRTAVHGDGWYGVWVSPERFAATTRAVEERAAAAARAPVEWRHSLLVWCGLGDGRAEARRLLAGRMESLYGVPYERFERYSPHGTPEQVAEALAPYVTAGCRSINLIAVSGHPDEGLEGAAEVARLLRTAAPPV